MAKQLSGAGLRGQVAGKTALSTVGKSGSGLTYRGYDVKDLAQNCQFEEVAYLILKGKLPNQSELDAYKTKLRGMRGLPTIAGKVELLIIGRESSGPVREGRKGKST